MGRYKCSAARCNSSSEPGVTFFKFPLYNERKLKKWLMNMKCTESEDWSPSRFSVLCIKHFEERYILKTGKSIRLHQDAVPTIFASPDKQQNKKGHVADAAEMNPAQVPTTEAAVTFTNTENVIVSKAERSHTENEKDEEPTGDPQHWKIIIDEDLRTDSLPHFFHGDYCVPQSIQWVPDYASSWNDSKNLIEVKEPWEWLGLDVRGPLPETVNGHRYILSVTDYYSKWVEAMPMQLCLASHVAKLLVDVIVHFGFPLRILSRLPLDIVHKINEELNDQLNIAFPLVVHHQRTGTADVFMPHSIDRMVNELIYQHTADWDVYLPAKVFSLCFQEHSKTKERPFSMLYCRGVKPVHFPRKTYDNSKIQESIFIIR
ncbi:uncharacterized protein zgc:153292 isoform X2 [Thalassophryne amazonica]|uniref:uncharacterized protein zgc:153292 isoform X2 n=1 Tax=Thalassophryne amazonica TaxID=390379 RepID=UPI0014709D1B|nr:uncharacterized protein zgc:153292 isoform X2 [Thalassophryne amazonica]